MRSLAAPRTCPTANAYRPGDIWGSLDGKTVEIVNTDAEGRLVLADALAYARTLSPDFIVDNATLTGACVVALGTTCSGWYASDEDAAREFAAAIKDSGESMWRMPLLEDLREQIKSDVADVKQTGDRYGGSITAALFLREFVGAAAAGSTATSRAPRRSTARAAGRRPRAPPATACSRSSRDRAQLALTCLSTLRTRREEARPRGVPRAIADFSMIEEGDRLLVAVSGGKDSYTMLHLLRVAAAQGASALRAPRRQRRPGPSRVPGARPSRVHGARGLRLHDDRGGHLLDRHGEDPAGQDVLLALLAPSPRHPLPRRARSSAATRSRSAITATTCSRRFFSTCSSPGSSARCRRSSWRTEGRLVVVRPLVYCAEEDIRAFAELAQFPILPCDLCGSQEHLQRKAMARLLDQLERDTSRHEDDDAERPAERPPEPSPRPRALAGARSRRGLGRGRGGPRGSRPPLSSPQRLLRG